MNAKCLSPCINLEKEIAVIIKPTLACNLACSYCSVWEKKVGKMSMCCTCGL